MTLMTLDITHRHRRMNPRIVVRAFLLAVLLTPLPVRLVQAQPNAATTADSGGDVRRMLERARTAGVPGPDLDDLMLRGREAGLTDAQLGRFVTTLAGLAEDGLPLKPMLDRMRQGLVKKAPPERIDFAVTKLDRRLRESGRLVDEAFPGVPVVTAATPAPDRQRPAIEARRRLIDQAAFALDQGVPPAALRTSITEFTEGATPADRLVSARAPMLALTSLTIEGMAPEAGLAMVRDFHAAGARGPAMEDLGFGVAQAVKHGADPNAIHAEIRDAISRGIPPGQILKGIRDRARRDGPPGGHPPGHGLDRPDRGGHGGPPPPPDDPGRRGRRGNGRGHGTGRGGP
jgi:hypothetical protein